MIGMTLFWDAISFKNWNLIFATVQKHFYGIVCSLTWFHTVFGQQEQSPIIGTQNIRAKEINAMPSRILSLLSLTVNTAIDIADEFHFLVLVVFLASYTPHILLQDISHIFICEN
jgi:hypothetical protein